MSSDLIHIDGSFGEGGGQILRTSLALSVATGRPFRIENIRANRSKPGLLRQHLTAVQAATAISGARVVGDAVNSTCIEFHPDELRCGDYHFSIGTAGSTTLVLQTILPALMLGEAPSTISLEGGTHNAYAPSVHFLTRAFLPLVERMGPRVSIELERHGFYPAGGGRICARIEPVKKLTPLTLLERGDEVRRSATATVANLSGDIAKRELAIIQQKLSFPDEALKIEQIKDAIGPGNILSIEIESEHVTEVFTGFGERGVAAERIAAETAKDVRRYLGSTAPVGRHLADQLMIPFALAGDGEFRTGRLSGHSETNLETIGWFLPSRLEVVNRDDSVDIQAQ